MRPTFTIGSLEAKVSTTAIWSSTRKVSRMVIRMKFREALRAIAALEQERLARRDLRQIGGQRARLAREHQRGI